MFDLCCDDRKCRPCSTGAMRLNRSIESENAGGIGDPVNILGNPAHLIHGTGKSGNMLGKLDYQTGQITEFLHRHPDDVGTVVQIVLRPL